ncbi:MAG: hypothetical protein ACJ746_28015 [Bryobacteraceae bacterium]
MHSRYAWRWRVFWSAGTLAGFLAGPPLCKADLPIKHVVLYKHGIGFFERAGTVASGEQARLEFKTNDMNDILKSLIVNDLSGNRVLGIRYDSNETLQQRLQDFPFVVGNGELISAFLDGLKGAKVELKTADRPVAGTILGARAIQSGLDSDRKTVREQVSLVLDSGDIATYDLGSVSSLHLLDPQLQTQLKKYLQAVNEVRSLDKRSIYIEAPGSGQHNLHVQYVTPAAIWKSSYRLALDSQKSTLEGWAIVDNTTDEDWNDVQLSIVSGRPISFISQLDTPRYGQRQVAELPDDKSAGPVVYGGSVDSAKAETAGVLGGVAGSPQPQTRQFVANELSAPKAIPRIAEHQTQSTVEGASGAPLGELFEYNFAEPITVKRSQSAMLPFVQGPIAARKLLIYSSSGSEYPVNAAEVTNNTAKTLDGGPVTVYDSGAYAGEALVETLKAGDKRLIGYAVDYGTRVTTAFDSPSQTIREIHVENGVLQMRYADHQTRTYTIKNVDAKAKTLIIQQEGVDQYTILSPKPVERTASAYRFEVSLPANGTQTLKIEGEHVYLNTTEVVSTTPDFLLSLVQNKQLSDAGRKQLAHVLELKRQAVQADGDLRTTETQLRDLTSDQARLRQNIDSLNRVSGQEEQVRRYASSLSANEAQIATVSDRQRSLREQKARIEADVRAAVAALSF